MKKLTLIVTFILSLMMSSVCFAEWVKLIANDLGTNFYVDLDRIKKHDGYVYSWGLADYLTPSEDGDMSLTYYSKIDCNFPREQTLQFTRYKGPMGEGVSNTWNSYNKNWKYPQPNSVNEFLLKTVCNHAK
jgi:hypothetical protein